MAVVVISATERSALEASAPTAAAIGAAMRRARLPGGVQERGDWLGSAPRVTRTATVGERFGTTATWVYAWPTDPPPGGYSSAPPQEAPARELADNVARELATLSRDWQGVDALAYSLALNGELGWWASGLAAETRTRDQFPTGAGRLDAPENPLGPTSDATHPTSPADALRGLGETATTAVWVVGGLAAIYLLTRD